jgi:hypothetical protein
MEIVSDFDVRSLLQHEHFVNYMRKVHLNKRVKVIVHIFSKKFGGTSKF